LKNLIKLALIVLFTIYNCHAISLFAQQEVKRLTSDITDFDRSTEFKRGEGMNEELLKEIYNSLGFDSSEISFEQFKLDVENDPELRKVIHQELEFDSGGIDFNQFEQDLGVGQVQEPEKGSEESIERLSSDNTSFDRSIDNINITMEDRRIGGGNEEGNNSRKNRQAEDDVFSSLSNKLT